MEASTNDNVNSTQNSSQVIEELMFTRNEHEHRKGPPTDIGS